MLITATRPGAKGECLEAREQDLAYAQVLELYKMMWSLSCDNFALQNKTRTRMLDSASGSVWGCRGWY